MNDVDRLLYLDKDLGGMVLPATAHSTAPVDVKLPTVTPAEYRRATKAQGKLRRAIRRKKAHNGK